MNTSQKVEKLMVGVGSAAGAAAAYVATQPLPIETKTPIVAALGTISVSLLSFWSQKVNVPKE